MKESREMTNWATEWWMHEEDTFTSKEWKWSREYDGENGCFSGDLDDDSADQNGFIEVEEKCWNIMEIQEDAAWQRDLSGEELKEAYI